MKEIFETISKETEKYLVSNGLKSMVLGISGGIDSTVVAAICSDVSKRSGIPLIGVSLVSDTNEEAENIAADLVGNAFCGGGANYYKASIQSTYGAVSEFCQLKGSDGVALYPGTKISEGNIKARLRMIALYNIASQTGGLVMDTDNLTEHYLGFFTIHGDVADLNPIGDLWKHEVYELAEWIRDNSNDQAVKDAINASINLVPTDGNGVMPGGDLAQIAPGSTYNEVDAILGRIVNGDLGGSGKTFDQVLDRYKKSEYKRSPLPARIRIPSRYFPSDDGR